MREVKIKNRRSLLSSGNKYERKQILDSIEAGLNSVYPSNLVRNKLQIKSNRIFVLPTSQTYNLGDYHKILVVGGGKASGALAQELERMLGNRITDGYVNILEGTRSKFRTERIELNQARHPTPDQRGVNGTRKILKILNLQSDKKTLVICLISGGGSSLMALPAKGITLNDKIATTDLLLRSGANIDQINCVRKHMSGIKGGQLVQYTHGATVLSLIVSDVVGDHLESIASGPTVPDSSTFSQAKEILRQFKILNKVPPSVRNRIEEGVRGLVPETPKPNDPLFSKVSNVIIGSNEIACEEIIRTLKKRLRSSVDLTYLGSAITGEASLVARKLLNLASRAGSRSTKGRTALVWGGETTVTVRGNGVGGRNQEEALSALLELAKRRTRKATLCFVGTDGIDGKTNAAGAIVDYSTFMKATEIGLNGAEYLERNDSNTFFRNVGNSLIISGSTGTNVNDVGMAILTKSAAY